MSSNRTFKQRLGMETLIQAEEAQARMLRRNRKARRKDKSLRRISRCKRKNRCQTEACPVCRYRLRLNLIRECRRLGFDKAPFTRVSFVPDKMLWAPGTLHQVDIKGYLEALRKRLDRSALADLIMIGGLDISFNTFENNAVGWQGHFYILINAVDTAELRKAFTDAIKPDPSVERPFAFEKVNAHDFFKCLTYAYKNVFYRRSGHFEKRLKNDGTPRRRTSPQTLSNPLSIELDSWLAGYPVGARLFLRNVRRGRSPVYARFALHLAKPFRDA
ncbi:hypothetical protein [Hoeflea alexandrii]